MMETFTTKDAAKLVRGELTDPARQPALIPLENESHTIQLELTSDELDDYERQSKDQITADLLPNDQMARLLQHLESEQLLEPANSSGSDG